MEIELPNNWNPRAYQRNLWHYLENGGKRAVALWHRRAGKDDVALHYTATALHKSVGTYWHMLPEAAQARKAIWDSINPHTGQKRIDEAFPLELRSNTRSQDMLIEFKCGSTWQLVGSDNYNSLVGTSPRGIVFSEWSLADPTAWAYLRPILLENDGWALFIYTSRGKNHGMTTYQNATELDDWFAEKLTVENTGVFTEEQLVHEKQEYIKEHGEALGNAFFMQEYFCSFEAPMPGAIWATEMAEAEQDSRITIVPYDARFPVNTWWDLGGRSGNTSIWFEQAVGREVHVIDFEQRSLTSPETIVQLLKEKHYNYGVMNLPHDGAYSQHTLGGGSIENMYRNMYPEARWNVLDVPNSVVDGNNAARPFFKRCVFDEKNCEEGLSALRSYRHKVDDKNKTFGAPLHDWASHGADAFRYMATNYAETFSYARVPQPTNKAMGIV